ncbi:hypothetical protein H5T89_10495 [bacterium]|nr:hypothetical protein [bacterium]
MSEGVRESETQEGVSLEYTEKEEKKERYEEIPVKEEKEGKLFSQKDIIRSFIFYELISKSVSMRR